MKKTLATCAAVIAFAAATLAAPVAANASTLDQVKSRGYLSCGSNPGLVGVGLPDVKGQWTGVDIELLGTEPISTEQPRVFPSDHFGVWSRLEARVPAPEQALKRPPRLRLMRRTPRG